MNAKCLLTLLLLCFVLITSTAQEDPYGTGSGITIPPLDKTLSADLQLLCNTWGFLKYYHPVVASGKLQWDYELFRFLPSYLKAKSGERGKLLITWTDNLGPLADCKDCKNDFPANINLKPDLKWFEAGSIDPGLKKKLTEVYAKRNSGTNHYISLQPGVGNAVFSNENPYKQFDYPDQGYRLLALFRYWNMIQYFFPYKYAIGEDWNNVLTEFIPRFIQAKDRLEYRLVALELIGRIHDTHANIWGQDTVLTNFRGTYKVPAQVKFIENKLVVTGFYDPMYKELALGDEITAINGKAVDAIVKEKLKFFPASNYPTKLRDIGKDMLRGKETEAKLTIVREGKKADVTAHRVGLKTLDATIDWAYNKPDHFYRKIENDIGYIYLGNVKSEEFPEMFKQFEGTKGIVIDIRNYPSEFVVFSLTRYFLKSPAEFVKFTSGDINRAGLFQFTEPLKVGEENPAPYPGKVVVLINEMTQSQAEYTTMALRTIPGSVVIGSTTAAADGNICPIYLPGNLFTYISGIGVYYPDGRETQRIGIIPDIEVKPTIKGVKEGKDELLEKAIEVIRSKE